MQLDRFTQKAQEAVLAAQRTAETLQSPVLDAELLLAALLGGKVHVTTLKGRVLLTIPEGTQNGRTFRLTGQGMPRFNADGTGDLYARVRVVLPTNLSDEAKEGARRFLELAPQPDAR